MDDPYEIIMLKKDFHLEMVYAFVSSGLCPT